jgi:outer membrane receptor protein involved in Fe transport
VFNPFKISIILCLCVAVSTLGQTVKGSIGGTVSDPSGRAVAGARIELVNEETNKRRIARTSPAGAFLLTALAPGTYRIDVERDGFRKHTQTLVLAVNQEIDLTVPLLAGSRTDSVSVSGQAPMTRTESASMGGVINTRAILGLPLDGRNFYELGLLLPGVVPAAPGSAGSVRGDFAINVNGGREDSNNFLLDGVYNGDPKLNGFGVNPPVDAIREFEVLTNAYDASFGRNAGGQVNVVTKSGTNQVHGTIYEFFRNAGLDARNFFAPSNEASPKYQRNQFGASAGGPLVKDRTFLFGDYQGRRVREGITRITNVPTLAERRGDFSQSLNPPINPLSGQPFPGNQLPQMFQHPVGSAIANLYPLPNRDIGGQNFVSSPTLRDREDQFDIRLDHSLSQRSEISARYSFADRLLYDPFSGPTYSLVPGFGTDIPRRAQNAMISETHVFTPTLLNELRAGFDRVALSATQENVNNNLNQQVGLPAISAKPRDAGLSFITITGYSPLGDEGNNPQRGVTNSYELLDHLTWTRGRHTARFGFGFRALQQNAFRDVQSRGFLNFSGLLLGNPLAELLLGAPTITGVARLDNPQYLRSRSYNGFAQDTFRLRPDLTLTLGVRYEYNTPPADADDRANLYDPVQQTLVRVGTNGMFRGGFDPDRNNIAPRVGLAWSPGGKGETVVRAGYGVYHDQSSLAPSEGLYFSPPYFNLSLFATLPQVALSLSDPFPADYPFAFPPSATAFQRDMRTPYMQHWNLNVQWQLGRSRVLEVGYVGSKGTKLYGARDINQPLPADTPQYMRPVLQFEDINLLESRGNSNYNSLQTRFEQRLRAGLSALVSYTWSKSIDEGSSFFTSAGDPNFPQNSRDLSAERGRSNFDVRHRMSISYGYDLPFKGLLLGGWQTFGILTFQSGRPLTVALLSDWDNSNTGRSNLGFGANDRPDVLHNPNLDEPTAERWIDTAAFVPPARGNFGNAGRNIVEGPGYQTVNVSLIKNTRVAERSTVQFRAEVFNLLNRTNFGMPGNFLGSPSFGQVMSAESPRRIQLGLKLLF